MVELWKLLSFFMSLHEYFLNINDVVVGMLIEMLIRRVLEFLLVQLVRIIVVWRSLIVIDLVIVGKH